jgi:MOSC domain-containing protein YiiM
MSPVGPARIVQISVSNGGVPKRAVPSARVTVLGLEGDAHRNIKHHGGLERAVCHFSLEAIRELQDEGHPVEPGSLGENVTIEGLDWNDVVPDARLRLGSAVVLEITRYTTPCFNIRPSFADGDYSRVSQKRHPGRSRLYARVLATGVIRTGDDARLEPKPEVARGRETPAS